MPNLINPCDALAASAELIRSGGHKSASDFKKAFRDAYGAELDDATAANLFGVGREYAARQGKRLGALDAAVANRAKALTSVGRTGALEAVSTARKGSMLSGVATSLRNALSNATQKLRLEGLRPVDAAVDLLVSKVTGVRTTEFGWIGTGALRERSAKAAAATLKDVKSIARHGATAEDLARVDVPRGLNTGVKWIDAVVNTGGKWQSMQDRPWYQSAYFRSIEEQANLMAKAEKGLENVAGRAKYLRDNPTEAMKAQAAVDAELATFSSDNALSSWLGSAKRHHPAISFAIDLVMPFRKIPINIGTEIATANPVLGPIKAGYHAHEILKAGAAAPATRAARDAHESARTVATLVDLYRVAAREGAKTAAGRAAQKKLSQSVTNGAAGTALMGYGWWLASQGLMVGASSSDATERSTNEALGIRPASLVVGDRRISVTGLHPFLNVIALGATKFANDQRELEKKAERGAELQKRGLPNDAVEEYVDTLARDALDYSSIWQDQPYFSGIKAITDTMRSERSLNAYLGTQLGSFVPAIVRDLGTVAGDTEVVRGGDGLIDTALARVPWVRAELPAKSTSLGQDIPAPRGWEVLDVFNTTVDPRSSKDPVKRWMAENKVKVGKPQRQRGESGELYGLRLRYVGEAIRQRLELEAKQGKVSGAEGRARLERVISMTRKMATARWEMQIRQLASLGKGAEQRLDELERMQGQDDGEGPQYEE